MFADGQRVSYVGDPTNDGLEVGDEGIVAQAGHTASYVRWTTGERKGVFSEMPHHEISPLGSVHQDIDALSGSLVTFAVKDVHAQVGSAGLLDVLNREGHLGSFESIGEKALAFVASLIRTDPSIREVLAHLDDDDGDDFVATATVALVRDAFGPGE